MFWTENVTTFIYIYDRMNERLFVFQPKGWLATIHKLTLCNTTQHYIL